MLRGEIHDRARGGFYRLADSRDWRDPLPEKTLEGNAGLLENYLEAWLLFGYDSYRKVAVGIVEFVRTTLWDREE